MPIKRVQFPDGSVHRIEVPEGATNEQIIDFVKSQHPAAAPATKPAQASSVDRQHALDQVYGVNQNVADFGRAALHHAGNFFHGTAQLVEHGLNAMTGYPGNATVAKDDAAMKAREQAYQASTGDTPAAYGGAAVGEILPYTVGLPEKVLSGVTARIAPAGSGLLRKIAAGWATGSLIGLTAPVTGDGGYAKQKAAQVAVGGLVGGGIPAGFAAASGVGNGLASVLRPIFQPDAVAAENLARLYGSDPATLAKLQSAPTYFPGETVTAAQALATPKAAMVEKALRNRPDLKAQFMEADNANNAARVSLLRDMAGNDQSMTAAVQSRRAATDAFLKKLPQQSVDPAPIVQALQRLQGGALGVNSTVKGAARDLLAEIQSHQGQDGKVQADILDAIRQNAKTFLEKNAPKGAVGNKEQVAIEPIKAQIIRTLDSAVPGYRAYLATYRSKSAPINTMEAARRTLGPVDQRGVNSSGDSRLSLASLNAGLNKADRSVYGFDPQARTTLEGLRQSLQRESISGSVPSAGSDTSLNLQSQGWLANQLYGPTMAGPTGKGKGIAAMFGAMAGHSVAPGVFGEAGGASLALGLKKAADAVNSRITERVAKGAMNSQEAARMIQDFVAHNPTQRQALLKAYPQWVALLTQQ